LVNAYVPPFLAFGVDDVLGQRGLVTGEYEAEEAGNADRVRPRSVRDRQESDACDEEGGREVSPCETLVASA
jgi:hypothetical protein